MICYYRNGISCGANRKKFEDQSVIKGKFDQIGIRLSWSLIWGDWESKKHREREKKKEEKKKKKKRKKAKKGMDCMDFWTFVWICMDISLFHF